MRSALFAGHRFAGRVAGPLLLGVAVLSVAACAGASSSSGSTLSPTAAALASVPVVTIPPMPRAMSMTDPRVGLRAGMTNAGVAAHNMVLVSHSSKSAQLDGDDFDVERTRRVVASMHGVGYLLRCRCAQLRLRRVCARARTVVANQRGLRRPR